VADWTVGALAAVVVPLSVAAEEFGQYRCQVEKVHGIWEVGKLWENGDLLFDADAGTLDGSFDPDAALEKKGIRLPRGRLFSRLKVETPPSKLNNLIAVQYDHANPPEFQRPIVAWLMLETMDSATTPRFQFFSNTIRSIAIGRCARRVR